MNSINQTMLRNTSCPQYHKGHCNELDEAVEAGKVCRVAKVFDKERKIIRMDFHQHRVDVFRKLIKEHGIEFKEDFPVNTFVDTPASTKYHGAYEGGLLDHSIATMEALLNLTEKLKLKWQRESSPVIVGLFHDLCKIDAYEEDGAGYKHSNTSIIDGHGSKSIIYLQRYIDLTDEEVACIRWHMGAFDDKQNWDYYSRAIEKYPNVLYAHTADMIASKIVGV